jgi:uncharacterized membrane protein (UPF0127 family)
MEDRIKKRPAILLFILGLTILLIGVYIYRYKHTFLEEKELSNKNSTGSIKPVDEQTFIKKGKLIFFREKTKEKIMQIDIEVADDSYRRAKGLMYRDSLPYKAGMLFIYEQPQLLSFWMKNTYISLDIIFADENMQIVTIHKNTKPLSEQRILSYRDSMYVIEVNAGFCDKQNIKIGDYFRFEI